MVKVGELMGGTDVEPQMKEILEFEKKLASVSREEARRKGANRLARRITDT